MEGGGKKKGEREGGAERERDGRISPSNCPPPRSPSKSKKVPCK